MFHCLCLLMKSESLANYRVNMTKKPPDNRSKMAIFWTSSSLNWQKIVRNVIIHILWEMNLRMYYALVFFLFICLACLIGCHQIDMYYWYFMKLFIDLGNVSSLDPTRERAKRSLAVSKDVRMGPTLDAWRGQGDATFPRHHRRLTSGMLTRKYCHTCNLSLFWFFFLINCVLEPSEAIRGCFLVSCCSNNGKVRVSEELLHIFARN